MRDFLNGAVADRVPRLMARAGLSLGLAGLFLWLLFTRLAEVDPAEVSRALCGVLLLHWSLALGATAVSFWAVGQYDAVVHRYLDSGVAPAAARRAGVCAIAVSQMLGLGVITGTVLRLRMLPGQSTGMAAQLTAAVALSFLAGWAVVTALVLLIVPSAPFRMVGGAVLALAGLAVAMRLVWPDLTRRWPNLFTQGRLCCLAAVDTIAAAVALYCLLPADLGLSFAALLPAFLIAQGAGLVSGSPGGFGSFEVTLLALLPTLPQDPMLAAILAWRMTYYAVPALLGGIVAAIGPGTVAVAKPPPTANPAPPNRAETLIEAQGEHRRLPSGDWLVGRTPHVLVGLFDALDADTAALRRLGAAADQTDRWPAIYKCSGRTAAVARNAGWHSIGIAREAWLDPRGFDLATASRSGLRRKLRRAASAGVLVSRAADLPLAEMERVAAVWSDRHGGERGFSMGRFARGYVSGQEVFLARCYGRLVGFVTFHRVHSEWTLDLMRHAPEAPDGTMHALVAAAIAEAGRLQVPRLSLAAVPEAAFGRARPMDRLLARFGCDGAGLLQFKSAFNPRWAAPVSCSPASSCPCAGRL